MKIIGEKRFAACKESISDGVLFINEQLKALGFSDKKCAKFSLISEEVLLQSVHHCKPGAQIRIIIGKRIKNYVIKIHSQGDKFTILDNIAGSLISDPGDGPVMDAEQTDLISNMILKSYAGDFSLKNVRGFNKAEIKVGNTGSGDSYFVFWCMIIGIIAGLLLKMILPDQAENILSTYVLDFISQIFIKGIRAVVTPLVFFAIASSLAEMTDWAAFGRTGAKVIISYFCTTIAAIIIAFALFQLIRPGDPSMKPMIEAMYGSGSSTVDPSSVSLFDTLSAIFPDNIVTAFSNADMLQIIVISILVGAASGSIGEYSESMQTFLKTGNALFQKIIEYITKLLPLAVFCLMSNLVLTTDYTVIMQISKCVLTDILAILGMMLFYSLLLVVFARINPLDYFRTCKESILTAFTTCSSSVAMPTTMKCLDNFGVSPKIYSFSIPLGTTINMDGTSTMFIITTLFMTRIYGITLSPSVLMSLFLTVILFSMATPAGAGSGLAMEAMLLAQAGVPGAAVGFVVPIMTLCDFLVTMNNVAGDGVVTTIVAKSDGLFKAKKMS